MGFVFVKDPDNNQTGRKTKKKVKNIYYEATINVLNRQSLKKVIFKSYIYKILNLVQDSFILSIRLTLIFMFTTFKFEY